MGFQMNNYSAFLSLIMPVRVDFSQTTYTVTEGTEMSVTVTIVRTGNMTDSASFTAFTVAVTAKGMLPLYVSYYS